MNRRRRSSAAWLLKSEPYETSLSSDSGAVLVLLETLNANAATAPFVSLPTPVASSQRRRSSLFKDATSQHVSLPSVVYHWVPKDEKTARSLVSPDDYDRLQVNEFTHITHFVEAAKAFQENKLPFGVYDEIGLFKARRELGEEIGKRPSDSDTSTAIALHQDHWRDPKVCVLLSSPWFENNRSRLGTVSFTLSLDVLTNFCRHCYPATQTDQSSSQAAQCPYPCEGWHYFLTEIVEYETRIECHIMINRSGLKPHPFAVPYRPWEKGGPWWAKIGGHSDEAMFVKGIRHDRLSAQLLFMYEINDDVDVAHIKFDPRKLRIGVLSHGDEEYRQHEHSTIVDCSVFGSNCPDRKLLLSLSAVSTAKPKFSSKYDRSADFRNALLLLISMVYDQTRHDGNPDAFWSVAPNKQNKTWLDTAKLKFGQNWMRDTNNLRNCLLRQKERIDKWIFDDERIPEEVCQFLKRFCS